MGYPGPMSTERERAGRRSPEPPLGPNFPNLSHPDLDTGQTEDVEEPPNKDDVKPDLPNPEPPG